MYNEPSKKSETRKQAKDTKQANAGMAVGMAGTMGGENIGDVRTQKGEGDHDDDDDEREEPQLSLTVAIITLAISTTFVAFCAEFMVSSM